MADPSLNKPVVVQATRIDASILPRNIFSQSYLLYVINQGTDVGSIAEKANQAGGGAYDAQVRNDEQDLILDEHEKRIAKTEEDISGIKVKLLEIENDVNGLKIKVQDIDGKVSEIIVDYVSLSRTGTQTLSSSLSVSGNYSVNGTKVVGARQTGWTAATGTANKGAFNADLTFAVNDTISKLQAYRDELTRNAGASGPVAMDLQQLSGLRSQFRQDVKGERTVLPNRSDAAIQRIYNAMTSDIDSAIGQNLGNDTLRRYKQANAIYADEANKLQNTRLKNVIMKGDLTPEVVNNMLFSKNKSEVQNLYRSVGQVGRAQMRNGIIGKAMEKSGGSPDQFLRQVNLMSNQTGIAFKGRDAAYLKGIKNYLEATKRAGQAGVTTPTGQQTIPFILGIGTVTNPALVGVGGGYGLLARMYESEPARNAMLRLANTPRGSTAFEKALAEVERAVNSVAQGAKSDALSE
ncbi:TPA_asm: hypothetical protein G4P13_000263 [Salmonella enterica subsp. enterica serovar Carrau]|nr:hypothetical protein [Salmonella enterica]MIH10871.1 hypothetical protein [Salmonella enterica subsp. enterica]HAE7520511.1 hypothetical protein [Salmonella enterica subsp. enterica serovar Carrau]